MRSILRFVFVVVPTAALAGAVVVGVSRNEKGSPATSDGDLMRDLKLASSTLELAPAGQPMATVSAIEAPPTAKPEPAVRTKRSTSGPRAVRSRTPMVRAAPERGVAESAEESATTTVAEATGPTAESIAEAPAEGGVALPRPTAVPVSYPGTGAGDGGVYGDGGGVYGGGTVIRGGGGVYDPCRVHGPVYGGRRPVYQPRGSTLGGRVREAVGSGEASPRPRSPSSIGGRVREATGRSTASTGGSRASGSRGSLGGRVRQATGRSTN